MCDMEGYTIDRTFDISGEVKKKDLWRIFSSSLISKEERGKVKFQRDSKKGKKGVVVFIEKITINSSRGVLFWKFVKVP